MMKMTKTSYLIASAVFITSIAMHIDGLKITDLSAGGAMLLMFFVVIAGCMCAHQDK